MTEKIKLTSDELRLMSLFQNVTAAVARDCIVDEKMDRVIFVVNKGQMGLAIGKGGATIRQLQNVVARKVELVEFSDDPSEFLSNVLNSEMINEIKRLNRFSKKNNDFIRMFNYGVQTLVLDGTNRFLITKDLADFAGIRSADIPAKL
jgi:NusA-like KH domain protein